MVNDRAATIDNPASLRTNPGAKICLLAAKKLALATP